MKQNTLIAVFGFALNVVLLIPTPVFAVESTHSPVAGDAAVELAKKLQNPVASLIRVPIQNDWDLGVGPEDAMRYTANIQPVIPYSISEEWNLITRTILPFIHAESPVAGASDESGLGDVVQSFFFSPKKPVGGYIVAAGPVALWPTASDSSLGAGKWGAGPTALANHLWFYAGWGDHEVNTTFLQSFGSFTTKTQTTFGLNTESTDDWSTDQRFDVFFERQK